jgi:hypothetical protein
MKINNDNINTLNPMIDQINTIIPIVDKIEIKNLQIDQINQNFDMNDI